MTTERVVAVGATLLTLLTNVSCLLGLLISGILAEGSSRAQIITRGWSQEVSTGCSGIQVGEFTCLTFVVTGTIAGGTLGVTRDTAV